MGEKPITWEREGVPYYTASSLGRCLRSLAASRMSYTPMAPPEKLQKIFDAGHLAEDECVKTLRENHWTISRQQETVELDIPLADGKHAVVAGHIDGIGILPDHYNARIDKRYGAAIVAESEVIAEIKSQSASTFEQGEFRGALKEMYSWQASVYMHALDLPLCWIRWNRDASDPPLWRTQFLGSPPHSIEAISARIQAVEDAVAADTLPPCTENSWGCPFSYLHEEPEDDEIAEIPGIEELAAHYDEARRDEQNAKKKKDEVREYITRFLASHQVERAREGIAKITLASSTRTKLDEAAMEADGIDLDKYRTRTGFQSLRVTYGDR